MGYGIGMATAGIVGGYNQHQDKMRQQGIEDQKLAMDRQTHDARLKTYGLQAGQMRQSIEQGATTFDQQQYDRKRAEEIAAAQAEMVQAVRAAKLTGDMSQFGDIYARMTGRQAKSVRDDDGNWFLETDGGNHPLTLESVIDDFFSDPMELVQAEKDARAAELAHNRALELEGVKQRGQTLRASFGEGITPQMGEDGKMVYTNQDPATAGGGSDTAVQKNAAFFKSTFNVDDQTAAMLARNDISPRAVIEQGFRMAKNTFEDDFSVHRFAKGNPELAEKLGITGDTSRHEAIELYQKYASDRYLQQIIEQYSQLGGAPENGGPAPENPSGYGLPMGGERGKAPAPQKTIPQNTIPIPKGTGTRQNPVDADTLNGLPPSGTYVVVNGTLAVSDGQKLREVR